MIKKISTVLSGVIVVLIIWIAMAIIIKTIYP